ncbi:Arylsulfatase [bioreactor metagenome]|uniref:Arylsulfatase n=2 Tax=root TaxID=1 RepID=A0A645AP67_9ZZZZ
MSNCPNVVLFLSDDHAAWACGCYGNPDVHTPSLDYLADNGVQMLNAFTPTPVCSPARACLMTGRLASQHGVHDYIGTTDSFDVDYNWMQHETLLPQLFQQAGYETILIGKWHLGQERTAKQGFDQAFAIGPDYPIRHQGRRTWYRNDEPVIKDGLISSIITEEALDYLAHRTSEKPFLLVIGHYATHSPWSGHPRPLVEYYRKKHIEQPEPTTQYPFGMLVNEACDHTREDAVEALCQYYAGVTEIDTSVGAILQELRNQNLDESTLVVYTSDHGLNCGQHGLWGKGNATFPLNMVEQSIRIPLIFHAPNRLLSKQQRTEFVDHTDVFATILELAGIPDTEKKNRNSPGTSFCALLNNTHPRPAGRQHQFCEYGPVRMMRTHRHKLMLFPRTEENLFFDLAQDPLEQVNLYGNAEYQLIIDEMNQAIRAHFSTFSVESNDGVKASLPQYNPHVAWDYYKEYQL